MGKNQRQKELPTKEIIKNAASVGFGLGVANEYKKEHETAKAASKIKNARSFKDLKKSLKAGDIIFQADVGRKFQESYRVSDFIPRTKKTRFDVKLGASFADITQLSSGSKLNHVSIYLGGGKQLDYPHRKPVPMNFNKGTVYYVKRFAKNTNEGKKIANAALEIAKEGKIYPSLTQLAESSARRNIFDPKRSLYKKLVQSQYTTCSGIACDALEKGLGRKVTKIRKGIIEPVDLLNAKTGQFIAKKTGNIKILNKVKALSILGKGSRGIKGALIGAGVGAASAIGINAYRNILKKKNNTFDKFKENIVKSGSFLENLIKKGKEGVKLYKKGAKGRWVTVKGRKIFIPESKKY